jgi:four helix bundle protein
MTSVKSYKDLFVYQKAYQLCKDVHALTKVFPNDEIYVMVPQMRRSALSIPCNIAEGYRRKNRKEYLQFLRIALGSCAELETQISLAVDFEYASSVKGTEIYRAVESVGQLLYKLIVSLEK